MPQRWWVVAISSLAGCASTGAPAPTPPAADALRVAPEGAGVTLRWSGPRALSLPAVTEGLGPVLAVKRGTEGDLRLDHPRGVEERWSVTPEGAEQSWRFPAAPADGRVAVTVALAGAALDHADGHGLWLRTDGGEVVRYGHATWVDAQGRRTVVPSRWEGGRVALRVPPEVVAATAWPAVLDPLVSRPIVLAPLAPTVTRPGMGRPAAAFNHGVFMATWNTILPDPYTSAIQYARLSPTGEVLDSTGTTAVVSSATRDTRPSIAALGDGFLLAWAPVNGAEGVMTARLDAAGVMLDATPRSVLPSANFAPSQLACRSDGCVIVAGPSAARLDATGALVARLSLLPATAQTPAVVATAAGYVLAWSDSPLGGPADVFFRRLRPDGTAIDATPQTATAAASNRITPKLASDGTNALLVWNATAGAGSRAPGVYGALIPPSGSPATSPLVLGAVSIPAEPAVAWDGANYLVGWESNPFGTVRVSPTGAVLDAAPRTIEVASPHGSGVPHLVAGSAGVQAFWIWTGDATSFTAHLGPDGRATSPAAPLSVTPHPEFNLLSTWDGANFVVAWTRRPDRYSASSFFATRVSPAGVVVDRASIALGSRERLGGSDVYFLGLLATGTDYVLLGEGWTDTNRPLNALHFTAAGPTTGASVPYAGGATIAAYGLSFVRGGANNLFFLPTSTGFSALRVAPNGTVLDLYPTPLAWQIGVPPQGAFDGTNYFVVANGYGVRISADGDLLDASPRRLGPMPTGVLSNVSYGGGNFLVTWLSEAGGIQGVLVRPTGEVVDAAPRSFGTLRGWYRQVSDGIEHVLVYQPAAGGLAVQRVSFAGALIDPAPVPITTRSAISLSVAANTSGQTLVAAAEYDYGYSAVRAIARVIDSTSAPVSDAGVLDAGADVPAPIDAGFMLPDTGAADVTPTIDAPAARAVAAVDAPAAREVAIADAVTPPDVAIADVVSPPDVAAADAATADVAFADAGRDVPPSATDVGSVTPTTDVPAADVTAATDAGGASDGGAVCSARPWSQRGTSHGAWMLAGFAAVVVARRRRTT